MDDEHAEPTSSALATSARVADPPAGWFADPTGIYSQRYWDGEQWTAEVLDRNGVRANHPVRTAARLPEVREPAVDTSISTEPESDLSPAAFATRVLEHACDIAGVDVRDNAMTADQAIDALPADLAEATVRVMHRTYATAGDTHNAQWATAKLDEIRARPPEPRDEEQEQEQEQALADDAPEPAEAAPAPAPDPDPEPEPEATAKILAGWYRDPARRHQYRYWDGETWTDRVADNSVQANDPLRWEPPRATAEDITPADITPAEVARDDAPPIGDAGSRVPRLLARIRAMRTIWVISTVVFTVLAVGYLLLPVNESATSVNGAQTVSLHCGSVLSPEATTTGGAQLTNGASICSAARHSNTTRVWLFAALALLSVALAAFSKVTRSSDETGHSSQ